jgi:hypothetical protein
MARAGFLVFFGLPVAKNYKEESPFIAGREL